VYTPYTFRAHTFLKLNVVFTSTRKRVKFTRDRENMEVNPKMVDISQNTQNDNSASALQQVDHKEHVDNSATALQQDDHKEHIDNSSSLISKLMSYMCSQLCKVFQN
jgi:hypothetical protein